MTDKWGLGVEVEDETYGRQSFQEFMRKHGLRLRVSERARDGKGPQLGRYWVGTIPMIEEKKGGILAGLGGDGSTPRNAAMDLMQRISRRRVVIRAYYPDRREFVAPELWWDGPVEEADD